MGPNLFREKPKMLDSSEKAYNVRILQTYNPKPAQKPTKPATVSPKPQTEAQRQQRIRARS